MGCIESEVSLESPWNRCRDIDRTGDAEICINDKVHDTSPERTSVSDLQTTPEIQAKTIISPNLLIAKIIAQTLF